ncbi:hypothetical protein [Streptomyces nondiastaticus]|uniref:Uncharacterized protein n=1 Tax=Streptomyces nondiastaticus TaxID=3154512 RepID=A0ABW6TS40_9ACTN
MTRLIHSLQRKFKVALAKRGEDLLVSQIKHIALIHGEEAGRREELEFTLGQDYPVPPARGLSLVCTEL